MSKKSLFRATPPREFLTSTQLKLKLYNFIYHFTKQQGILGRKTTDSKLLQNKFGVTGDK